MQTREARPSTQDSHVQQNQVSAGLQTLQIKGETVSPLISDQKLESWKR